MAYDLQNCFGSRMRQLSRITDGYFRNQLVSFNITENQMTILFALFKLERIEQGKIGQTLRLERSTVSRNIKRLEKQGYVIRTSAYRPKIELSKVGNKLVQELVPLWEETMEELVDKLGEDGLAAIATLEKILK